MTGDAGICEFFAKAWLIFKPEETPYTTGTDFHWYKAIEGFTGEVMKHLMDGAVPTGNHRRAF